MLALFGLVVASFFGGCIPNPFPLPILGIPMAAAEPVVDVPQSQEKLRTALKSSLDMSIVTKTQQGGRSGTWLYLTSENMQKVFVFRHIHMKGRKRLEQWVKGLPSVDSTEQSWAFAFWHNIDDAENKRLPEICYVGLSSAARYFNVKLIAYQSVAAPPEVTVLNAEQFLPLSRVSYLLGVGVHIAHIADYVRLQALHVFGRGGWMIDCDTLWLRKPDTLPYPWSHPQYGHQFGSMRAARVPRTALVDFQHWSVHFLQKPLDKLYLASPFFFQHIAPCLMI